LIEIGVGVGDFVHGILAVDGFIGRFRGENALDCKFDGTPTPGPMTVKPESQVGHHVENIK
jgi:hypothetical protein